MKNKESKAQFIKFIENISFSSIFKGNIILWINIGILLIFSLLFKMSVVPNRLFANFIIVIFGVGIMIFFQFLKTSILQKLSKILWIFSVIIIIITIFWGKEADSSSRAIEIGGHPFNTFDFLRFFFVLYMAQIFANAEEKINKPYKFLIIYIKSPYLLCLIKCLGPAIISWALIFSNNLSTCIILIITYFALLFISDLKRKYKTLIVSVCLFMLLNAFLITYINVKINYKENYEQTINLLNEKYPDKTFSNGIRAYISNITGEYDNEYARSETHKNRILSWFNYWVYDEKADNQTYQALLAIQDGARGPGNSLNKHHIAKFESDFSFSVIVEEYGFGYGTLALILILCPFIYIFWFVINIIKKLYNKFDIYLCFGFAFLIAIQAFIHIMVNLYIIPNTGQSLPLISVGGTSTLFVCFALGVINNFNMKVHEAKKEKEIHKKENKEEKENKNEIYINDSNVVEIFKT